MEKWEPFTIAESKYTQLLWETNEIYQSQTNAYPVTQQLHFLDNTPERWVHMSTKHMCKNVRSHFIRVIYKKWKIHQY